MQPKFVDLFCGIGGFHVALARQGLQCVFASDIDECAAKAYEANFGIKPHGDIKVIDAKDIPAHDVLCGGFPCQPFSKAGKQKGTVDPRGQLFEEILRIAEYHKPSVLLLENVEGLKSHDKGQTLKEMVSALASLGYVVKTKVISAAYCGVPQERKRLYFVCTLKRLNLQFRWPDRPINAGALEDILEEKIDPSLIYDRDDCQWLKGWREALTGSRVQGIIPVAEWTTSDTRDPGQGQFVYSPKGYAPTLTTKTDDIKLGLIDQRLRKLSILEMKRIMGFPDEHVVDDKRGKATHMLGNAVVPRVIERLIVKLSKQLKTKIKTSDEIEERVTIVGNPLEKEKKEKPAELTPAIATNLIDNDELCVLKGLTRNEYNWLRTVLRTARRYGASDFS